MGHQLCNGTWDKQMRTLFEVPSRLVHVAAVAASAACLLAAVLVTPWAALWLLVVGTLVVTHYERLPLKATRQIAAIGALDRDAQLRALTAMVQAACEAPTGERPRLLDIARGRLIDWGRFTPFNGALSTEYRLLVAVITGECEPELLDSLCDPTTSAAWKHQFQREVAERAETAFEVDLLRASVRRARDTVADLDSDASREILTTLLATADGRSLDELVATARLLAA